MKHKPLLLMMLLIAIAFAAEANPVDMRTAREVATKFMNANAKTSSFNTNDLQLATTYSISRGDAAFHVFNTPSGFVIVSADDCASPILGYSDEGRQFDANNVPIQLQDILQEYVEQIQYAVEHHLQGDTKTAEQWRLVKTTGRLSNNRDATQVGPLLTTTWDQGQYYNAMCPEDANGPDGHALTGCVATAMAQIINYHQYPTSGRGTHSYESNYGTLTVNYASETYDYANMPNALTNESTEAQVNAVAQLMRDCGVAVNMGYGPGESGAFDHDARGAFINFFKYSPSMGYAEKKFYSESAWYTMLRNDLDALKPIYYSGYSDGGGHAFVCDGYNSEDYFSFNFGWNGTCNGWYLLDAVLGYNNNQAAILGIVSAENGNVILGQTSGTSYFNMDEPMEFYSSNGHNSYLCTEYTNNCYNQVLFNSSDITKTLVVDVIYYENQSVWFNTAINEHCFLSPSATDYSPFYMMGNVASLDYSGYINSKGFALYVRHEDDCQIPNIAIARDTTSVCVGNSYYEPSMSWQLEYGLAGFTQGEGVLLNVEASEATITNLTKYATYDFYARTTCGANQYSPWVKRTIELDPYWTDVVREQPVGFVVDANGNVEISSAEGLAWLSVLVNGFQGNQPNNFEGKTVTLVSDINLQGYRWYPMGRYLDWEWTVFSGTFEGQGHSISNIYVRDASSNLGLFGRVKKGRIRNVNMVGGSVSSTCEPVGNDPQFWLPSSTIGGLAGETRDCYEITNCHSSVNVSGNGGAGSLCGYIWAYENNIPTVITNCSASGTVLGREVCGGLIGGVFGDVVIRNCYATGDVLITTCDYDAWEKGRGGLIGSFRERAYAYNCFSTGIVHFDSEYYNPKGNIIGYVDQHAHIQYFYGRDDVNQELDLFGSCNNSSDIYISDTCHFYHNGNTNTLITPISIEGIEQTELLGALNAWVVLTNDQSIKTWIIDSGTGFPVFGDNYEPSCYNPSDVIATNATIVGNATIRTQLSWTQIGEPDHWEVLYVASEHDMSEGIIIPVDSNPCVLTGISVGHPLDFYVRAICGDNDVSGWSNPITYIPDKLRWTEVVTTQPEGYVEDDAGNVYISTAEGLAWLSSVSNGLNGVQYDQYRFYDKQIVLLADIDLSAYRWTPIAADWMLELDHAIVEGNSHVISGVYCNELEDNQGLFGYYWYGSISNLVIKQCDVYGENYSGVLAGQAYCVDITNCATTGNVYGIESVGGIIGKSNGSSIRNSYYIGTASSRTDITKSNSIPYCNGGICGVPNGSIIINCYVVSEISDEFEYSGIITSTGNCPEMVSNCYYKAYETTLPITRDCAITSNNSSFSGSGSTWTLNTPPYVNGAFRTDLLDALNAWVDANNTNGEYLHWVADTENQNGGFPMLEQPAAFHFNTAGDWSEASNWLENALPSTTDAVIINANCTLDVDAEVASLSVTNGKSLTIQPAKTLTTGIAGTSSSDGLIIQDGGQLVCNIPVNITAQKNIDAWSDKGGWYLIASPINSDALDPNDVTNLLTADDPLLTNTDGHSYDLYRLAYENSEPTWKNYRANSFNMSNGRGYLYANAANQTLMFGGATKPYNATLEVPVIAGWNLIGNPYTFNAYPNTSYYVMNDAKTGLDPLAKSSSVAVAPCNGIIVNAENAGNVIFSNTAPPSQTTNQGNLNIVVAQQDKAIVSFNKGDELEKFSIGNNSSLYIPQGDKDYAIAFSEGQGEMPINFKATKDGEYTITVNPEGVEMAYLHLIDNKTGTDIDLLTTPSHTFTAKTTDYASRFKLVFANGASTGSASETFGFVNAMGNFCIYGIEGEATVQVIDIYGRILSSETFSGNYEKQFGGSAGIYVIRLISGDYVKTQKVTIK